MTTDSSILFVGIKEHLVALEADSGRELWRYRLMPQEGGMLDLVLWCVDGDVIYAASYETVVALNRSTGSPLWVQRTRSSKFTTLHFESGRLYVGAAGELYCLNPSSGEILWHNELKGLGRGVLIFATTPALMVAVIQIVAAASVRAGAISALTG